VSKTRLLAGALVLIIAGWLLSGCSLFPLGPPPSITAKPDKGHPNLEEAGLEVSFYCTNGKNGYALDPGDGGEKLHSPNGVFSYTYTQGGVYTARVISGRRSAKTTVRVLNEPPEVLKAFTVSPMQMRGVVLYDARYRSHGCDRATGQPLEVYGARDPDDPEEALSYKWEASGPDRWGEEIEYSVFTVDGENITGKITDNAIAKIVIGWGEQETPWPFSDAMGIFPTSGRMTVRLTVYDPWGGRTSKTWKEQVTVSGC